MVVQPASRERRHIHPWSMTKSSSLHHRLTFINILFINYQISVNWGCNCLKMSTLQWKSTKFSRYSFQLKYLSWKFIFLYFTSWELSWTAASWNYSFWRNITILIQRLNNGKWLDLFLAIFLILYSLMVFLLFDFWVKQMQPKQYIFEGGSHDPSIFSRFFNSSTKYVPKDGENWGTNLQYIVVQTKCSPSWWRVN